MKKPSVEHPTDRATVAAAHAILYRGSASPEALRFPQATYRRAAQFAALVADAIKDKRLPSKRLGMSELLIFLAAQPL
jgi:hypothetical protein